MAKQTFKDLDTEPSDLFRRCVTDGGTMCYTECGHCGRVHFVSSRGHGDYEPGILEDLKAKAKAEPDRYVEESVFDGIEIGYIAGMNTVVHCRCNALSRYEAWIWDHRSLIIDYLTQRCKEDADVARRLHDKTEKMLTVHNALGRVTTHFADIIRQEIEREAKGKDGP